MEAERVLNEAIRRLTELRKETTEADEERHQRLANAPRDPVEMAQNERKPFDMEIRTAALKDAIETVGELRWVLLQETLLGDH